MSKLAIAVLLLAPAIGWAECGFVSSSTEMTIVVSKDSRNKCFDSANFREAFRESLIASVKAMDESALVPAPSAGRRLQSQKPPLTEQPAQQDMLYYGQKPKR